MMRILALLTDAFGGHGGIAKFNRDLLSALCLCPEVNEVVALPRLTPEASGPLPGKLQFDTSGVGGRLRFLRAAFRAARRAVTHSAAQSPGSSAFALILCGHINLLPAAFLARSFVRHARTPIPIALVIHGIDAWQPTRSWLVNRLVRRIDVVVSVSDFTKRRFVTWAKADHAQSYILPNSVDLDRFTPGPRSSMLLRRYGLAGCTVLLTVARLSASERYKGLDEVLRALPELAKGIPNLNYLIVGEGDDRERLKDLARSLGLRVESFPDQSSAASTSRSTPSARVVFAGHVPESEKVDHYRLADAFVMPGWGEGFGIVYLEALACGIPVVASKADASREVVQNTRGGVVVDPKNQEEISAGILRVLESRGGLSAEGVEKYSFARYCERVRAILQTLTGSEPPHQVVPASGSACLN